VQGVYFFLYNPNNSARLIDDSSIRLYLNEGNYSNALNLVRGRAFVDPNSVCIDSLTCGADTSRSVHGSFRLLRPGADQDYEILSDVYGPFYKVVRLHSALTGQNQSLGVTYRYRAVLPSGALASDSSRVGGTYANDWDGIPALSMMLLRPPTSE